jgi:hypothetical protein
LPEAPSRRGREAERDGQGGEAAYPSYADLRIESTIFAYVVDEGNHDEKIVDLALKFSRRHEEGDAVERAVRELVRARLLCMKQSRVVPGRAALAGRPNP